MSWRDTISFKQYAPEEVGAVVRRILRRKRFHEKNKYGSLVDAWNEVVGPEIAKHTRITSFQHGRLSVEVSSPILLQELAGFMRQELLEDLKATDGAADVADLRFRLRRAGWQ